MKIVLIFDDQYCAHTTGVYVKNAMEKLALNFEHYNPVKVYQDRTAEFIGYDAMDKNADLYLSIDDDLAYPNVPSSLRDRSAYWCIDAHRFKLAGSSNYSRLSKMQEFPLLFITQFDVAERFNAHWLPLACDPSITFPLEHVAKTYDWCFVGHVNTAHRHGYVELMKYHFPNCYVGQAFGSAMNEIYNASRIILNVSFSNDINMRFFEATASGSILLAKRVFNNEFALFNDSVLFFNDRKEILSKTSEILNNYEFYSKKAFEFSSIVREKHNYEERVKTILSIYKER